MHETKQRVSVYKSQMLNIVCTEDTNSTTLMKKGAEQALDRDFGDFKIDMNRKQQSMGENWRMTSAMNHYLSYGTEGTALVYLSDQTAALRRRFGLDEEDHSAKAQGEDGEISGSL